MDGLRAKPIRLTVTVTVRDETGRDATDGAVMATMEGEYKEVIAQLVADEAALAARRAWGALSEEHALPKEV